MKKNLKSIVALACASIVLLGTAACGNDGSSNAQTTTPPAPATQASTAPSGSTAPSEAPTAAGMDGWKQFEQKVTITVPVYDRSKEGYPAVDNNYWTKWVQTEFGDKWNVDVKYVAIPRSDVMTKYSLLIAGGDTPTILMEYDYPKVAQWANDGAMAELDMKAFSQVAPTFYGKMEENNQLGYTDINGKTYFALTERPYYNTGFSFATFYRKDWLDKLGLATPKSYAEYKAAIDAIIKAGLTDIGPVELSLPKSAYVTNFAFRSFPVDEAEWAMHSSLGTSSFSWEPTMKYIKRKNAEYNTGWYSKEFDLDQAAMAGSGGASQAQTDFINGKLFQYGAYVSANVDWLKAFYEKNPDAQLGILSYYRDVEPGFADYPQLRADNPFGMIVGFSSSATKEQLTAAWMLMEWMIQPETLFVLENGVEGVTYTMGENGLPVVKGDYRGPEMLNHNMNIDMTCLVHASKKIGTIDESISALVPQGLPQDFTADLTQNYKELKEIADKGWSYSDPVFSVAIESESEYSAPLLSLYQEYFVNLVKCKPEEFDALYADYSKKFLEAGYQEVIDERLKAYEAGNSTKLPK